KCRLEEAYAPLRTTYNTHTLNEISKFVSNKSFALNKSDVIYAKTKKTELDIEFKTSSGAVISSEKLEKEGEYKLTVNATEENFEIIAYEKGTDSELGKLNAVSYTDMEQKLVLVPVNDNTFTDLISEEDLIEKINKIFSPANLKWDISVNDAVSYDYLSDADATFEVNFPDNLRAYTMDMSAVINALK
ncbi:MAG: hypothetical protein GY756_20470, partial [bacterium]|nr:hypothetical protein [bacterium]